MTQDETEHERPDDRPLPGDGTYPAVEGRADDPRPAEDRPMPGDGARATDPDSDSDADSGDDPPPGPDAEPVYNDRDKLDFDPDDGLYTGTAVTGDTEIPGEHERVDDVPVDEDGDDAKSSDDPDDSSA